MGDRPDLMNRDPNDLNNHLKVQFEDVLGEPEGIHSIDCVWKLSYSCFSFWQSCCYKICTLLCGIFIAMELGCEFAQIAFAHVWFITPMLRKLEINCSVMKKVYGACIGCCLEPCCESCGKIFKSFEKH